MDACGSDIELPARMKPNTHQRMFAALLSWRGKKKKGAVSKQAWPPYNLQSLWTGLDLMCWAHLLPFDEPRRCLFLLLFGQKRVRLYFRTLMCPWRTVLAVVFSLILSIVPVLVCNDSVWRYVLSQKSNLLRCVRGPRPRWQQQHVFAEFLESEAAIAAPQTQFSTGDRPQPRCNLDFFSVCVHHSRSRRNYWAWWVSVADKMTFFSRPWGNLLAHCWGFVSLVFSVCCHSFMQLFLLKKETKVKKRERFDKPSWHPEQRLRQRWPLSGRAAAHAGTALTVAVAQFLW